MIKQIYVKDMSETHKINVNVKTKKPIKNMSAEEICMSGFGMFR